MKIQTLTLSMLKQNFFNYMSDQPINRHNQSAADLFPLGRAMLRPLQWLLLSVWSQAFQPWDMMIDLTSEFHDAIRVWTGLEWMQQGVPLQLNQPSITLCTDASNVGWGAYLLTEFQTVFGSWT